jgi:hypothetical protein
MSMRYKGGVISATPPTTSQSSASGSWTLSQQMQATGGGNWPRNGPFNYIENVFQTWLYTGNGTSQTITNGINLSGNGGLTWIKNRGAAQSHGLSDTARGAGNWMSSDLTVGNIANNNGGVSAFTSSGFSVNTSDQQVNGNNNNYVSWTFREQPKFFDVVTYTGTGSARTVAHNLGSVPGCIIVKSVSAPEDWVVYHRSIGATKFLVLNGTTGEVTNSQRWNNTEPTASVFTVGGAGDTNGNGVTYVAYLFAHNAGGFGLSGNENVISCGSYTTDGSGNATVNLGYEPQWILTKSSNNSNAWVLIDSMRGMTADRSDARLDANSSGAESTLSPWIGPTATGFSFSNSGWASASFIYIAIRRGPMAVPTDATKVNAAQTYTGNATSNRYLSGLGFPPDLVIGKNRSAGGQIVVWGDRLRGGPATLSSTNTDAENTLSSDSILSFGQDGAFLNTGNAINGNGSTYVAWNFRRAPGYFDEVCYTGTGSATTQAHNLGVAPELMIVKRRNTADGWRVYSSTYGAGSLLILQTNDAVTTGDFGWFPSAPSSSVFSIGTSASVNASGSTYVAYLFATCAGVSKVGSYTGTGATQVINCGFTGGARFVLIKATSTTGDWYVWDSARGIVAGNDPYLRLNSTAAEVTNTDWVDTAATGFELSNAGGNLANSNGVIYIFLAIA